MRKQITFFIIFTMILQVVVAQDGYSPSEELDPNPTKWTPQQVTSEISKPGFGGSEQFKQLTDAQFQDPSVRSAMISQASKDPAFANSMMNNERARNAFLDNAKTNPDSATQDAWKNIIDSENFNFNDPKISAETWNSDNFQNAMRDPQNSAGRDKFMSQFGGYGQQSLTAAQGADLSKVTFGPGGSMSAPQGSIRLVDANGNPKYGTGTTFQVTADGRIVLNPPAGTDLSRAVSSGDKFDLSPTTKDVTLGRTPDGQTIKLEGGTEARVEEGMVQVGRQNPDGTITTGTATLSYTTTDANGQTTTRTETINGRGRFTLNGAQLVGEGSYYTDGVSVAVTNNGDENLNIVRGGSFETLGSDQNTVYLGSDGSFRGSGNYEIGLITQEPFFGEAIGGTLEYQPGPNGRVRAFGAAAFTAPEGTWFGERGTDFTLKRNGNGPDDITVFNKEVSDGKIGLFAKSYVGADLTTGNSPIEFRNIGGSLDVTLLGDTYRESTVWAKDFNIRDQNNQLYSVRNGNLVDPSGQLVAKLYESINPNWALLNDAEQKGLGRIWNPEDPNSWVNIQPDPTTGGLIVTAREVPPPRDFGDPALNQYAAILRDLAQAQRKQAAANLMDGQYRRAAEIYRQQGNIEMANVMLAKANEQSTISNNLAKTVDQLRTSAAELGRQITLLQTTSLNAFGIGSEGAILPTANTKTDLAAAVQLKELQLTPRQAQIQNYIRAAAKVGEAVADVALVFEGLSAARGAVAAVRSGAGVWAGVRGFLGFGPTATAEGAAVARALEAEATTVTRRPPIGLGIPNKGEVVVSELNRAVEVTAIRGSSEVATTIRAGVTPRELPAFVEQIVDTTRAAYGPRYTVSKVRVDRTGLSQGVDVIVKSKGGELVEIARVVPTRMETEPTVHRVFINGVDDTEKWLEFRQRAGLPP